MLTLLSVHTDPKTTQAWKAGVKALKLRQGPAMVEALQLWLEKNQAEIDKAMGVKNRHRPNSPVREVRNG